MKGCMSKRDRAVIQQEYVQVCAELGELEFKAGLVKQELSRISDEKNNRNQRLQNLSKEFSSAAEAPEAPKASEQEAMLKAMDLKTEAPSAEPTKAA